ncbi:hypothetical protein BRARA_I05042 [Brassica rapa]|uniref:Pentacotripeptide-repeat region of PRORP domain-containing protein n=1 Tax=Brassica campestris TaxID=3711 RepID=A0A397Y9M8_BRACM|nr:hypothetical protein BRARA_I05042 [Brassica rapa]
MGLFPIWLFSSHVREGLIRRARRFYVVVTQSISHSEKVEKEGQFKVKALEINETGVLQIRSWNSVNARLNFEVLLKSREITPNKYTYTTMINTYCLMERFDEAYGFFKDMKKKRVVPDLATYTMIQDHIPELPGVEPDDVAYAALINGCCKNKCEDKAYNLIHEMVEKGMTPLEPCMDLYVKLIGEMVGNGMMAPSKACMDLHVLIHEMVEKGMTPPKACMATYVILRQEMVAPSEPCMDLHVLIHEMVEKGMTPLPEACKELFVVLIEDMVENEEMVEKGMTRDKACKEMMVENEMKPPEACKDLYVEVIPEMVEKGSRTPKAYMDLYVELTAGTVENGMT